MVDEPELQVIRARLSAIEDAGTDWQAEDALDTSSVEAERVGRMVWYITCGEADEGVPLLVADNVTDRATAEFIAAAPRDIRTLLDLLDSLRPGL